MDFTNDQLLRMDLFHFDEDRPNFNDLAVLPDLPKSPHR